MKYTYTPLHTFAPDAYGRFIHYVDGIYMSGPLTASQCCLIEAIALHEGERFTYVGREAALTLELNWVKSGDVSESLARLSQASAS